MDLMLDIETLSTRVDAFILQIAVVPFDVVKMTVRRDVFNRFPSAEGQRARHIDVDTVSWWMGQAEATQKAVFQPRHPEPLPVVLEALSAYVLKFQDVRLWCKGPEFDAAILKHAYESFGGSTPWNYRDVRDLRTALEFSLNDPREDRYPLTHNALDDAHEQIRDLFWQCQNVPASAIRSELPE